MCELQSGSALLLVRNSNSWSQEGKKEDRIHLEVLLHCIGREGNSPDSVEEVPIVRNDEDSAYKSENRLLRDTYTDYGRITCLAARRVYLQSSAGLVRGL